MKAFKKIEFNSCKLSNEEMKNIQGKYYGGYACTYNTWGNHYNCSSAASNCMTSNGGLGYCALYIDYSQPGSGKVDCTCE